MGLVLTSKTLDASDWEVGVIKPHVAINNLIYSGRYGSAENTAFNLADYTYLNVVGSPTHLGELVGTTFSNLNNYIETPLTQSSEFTLLAIVSNASGSAPYVISNSHSIESIGFTLSNRSMFIPSTEDVNAFTDIKLVDTSGFKVLVMRAKTSYVAGQVVATITNMTSGASKSFIPEVTGEAPAGGYFRIGSGYAGTASTATMLAAMGWNKWLTDTEIDEQYQLLKDEYPSLTF